MTHMDVITLSIDGTRIKEYPREMEQLLEFLPKLNELAKKYRFSLTSNYTATWEELANPAEIEKNILRYQDHIPFFYVMPVRKVGKVPLELLKNSQKLMKKYSLGFYSGPEYPDVENVAWYQKHCNPKLKIKVMASGELLYPCENFSGTVGSLIHHSIREV